jgi:hypothetical protein
LIDDARPWEEFDWVGRDNKLGGVTFSVDRKNGRCGSLGGHQVETSRTNGSRSSSSAMFMPPTISKKRSTPQLGTPSIFPLPFGPVVPNPACLSLKTGCQMRPSPN